MPEETIIDIVRGLHLVFLALGMGAALYLDFRTLNGLKQAVQAHDVVEMERIHHFVWFALIGLWSTGLVLIWIRTSFELSQFSPKLWCKLMIVSLMSLNASVIHSSVLPNMRTQIGRRLIDLDLRSLLPLVVVASISIFCWVNALVLGSSKVLKTASWDILTVWLSLTYVVVIAGGIATIVVLRAVMLRQNPGPDPFDKLLGSTQRRKTTPY